MIWVAAVGGSAVAYASEHGQPDPSSEQFGGSPVNGVAPAEDVLVEIEDADDRPVAQLMSRRDRPLWVSLPAGLYRFRFSPPRFRFEAVGATDRFQLAGLSTDAQATIEVPVLAGRYAWAVVNGWCDVPNGHGVQVQDLPTCTLTEPSDAGMP